MRTLSSVRTERRSVGHMQRYDALIALVLSGCAVSRELADLVVAGSEPAAEASVPVFSRPVVAGELETLFAAGLDEESAAHI